ncbi:hypothetical protein FHS42_002641 [Streptomyces zagrosensis]|uniref:Uncharacterized protein n=1 Tax=Streptomyces zagrosensis TaxID=1042984 RepID=A0A7W9UZA0_9ACTN|nr:hypothetical protein [Streptomyces zagrosensis]
MRLFEADFDPSAPHGLNSLPEVQVLWQMWAEHFQRAGGAVRRRDPKDRPPDARRLLTLYNTDARGSVKRDTMWHG